MMLLKTFLITAFLTGSLVAAAPAPTTEPPHYPTPDCHHGCGGECGDGKVQPPHEKCDLVSLQSLSTVYFNYSFGAVNLVT